MKKKFFGVNFDVGDRGGSRGIQSKWSLNMNTWLFVFVCVLLPIGRVDCKFDSTPKISQPETDYRLDYIRNMTRKAWKVYTKVEYPKRDVYYDLGVGDHTMARSMSTLWLLNLKAEFALAKLLLQKEPEFSNFENKTYVTVATVVADHIGSMLSCYALTGDGWFRDEAQKTANRLKPAYRTKGLPYYRLNSTNLSLPYLPEYMMYTHWWTQLGSSQHLEYRYLADLTKDRDFDGAVSKIRSILRTIEKPQGLYMTELDYEFPHWKTTKCSLYYNDFYSYFLKSYIQSKEYAQINNFLTMGFDLYQSVVII